jgi:hypothetical protein
MDCKIRGYSSGVLTTFRLFFMIVVVRALYLEGLYINRGGPVIERIDWI